MKCPDLHIKAMFANPTPRAEDQFLKIVIGMEGWQTPHPCRSRDVIQFLAKKHFFWNLRTQTNPHEVGVTNMTFLCRSGHFMLF